MKNILVICLFQLIGYTCFCQSIKPISYGDNPAAGKYYDIRGIKIYCEVYGSGKPLLMMHGNGGSIKDFEKNIPYFSKNYEVIVPDSRAQGNSEDRGDSLSFEMMADDAAVLLDTLHINAAYVIGWSDGGISALLLAMRYPEKVIKLAATGANLWPDSTAVNTKTWKQDYATYKLYNTNMIGSLAQRNKKKLFMLDWFQPDIELSSLQAIKCPSLIIAGDHDVITIEHTTLIYENIPQAYLWIIPDSGHRTMIEHANSFNKTVDYFFTSSYRKR